MAGSTGTKHRVTADINHLRTIISGYQFGFPIFKELLQNADDAKATRVDIGWHPGLPNAGHPLLAGPGLFILNNGEFTESNAETIQYIGLSDKAGQQSAIGKFGIGLKSIFHLCEAFFFLYSTQEPDAAGRFPLKNSQLFNPWKGDTPSQSRHPEWDDFTSAAEALLHEAVARFTTDAAGRQQRWFCIWAPLRRKEHRDGVASPIASKDFGDASASPADVLGHDLPDLAEKISAVLPLLKRIEQVRIWVLEPAGGPPRPEVEITLDPDTRRCRFDGKPLAPAALDLGGQITARSAASEVTTRRFRGFEMFPDDPEFAAIQDNVNWPRGEDEDFNTGDVRAAADKAIPHAAVVFSKAPARGNGSLSVTEAVFLPVGVPLMATECIGSWDYSATLHGYAFVNADRTAIDRGDATAVPGDAARAVKIRWNERILTHGTLPMVLPALNAFVKDTELSDDEATRLTVSLRQVPLLAGRRNAVCKDWQWAYCLTPTGGEWRLFPAPEPLLHLPPSGDGELHRAVFPALAEVCRGQAITLHGLPSITPFSAPAAWPVADIARLLESVPVENVFQNTAQADYLVGFLRTCVQAMQTSDVLQDRLFQLIRRAVHTLGPAVLGLSGHVERFRAVAGFLQPGRLMRVALGSDIQGTAARDATFRYLAGLDLWTLPLPDSLVTALPDSPVAALPATGSLRLGDAVSVFEALAHPPADLNTPAYIYLRTTIATQVVAAISHERSALQSRCGHLPLFRAWDGAQRAYTVLSWNDLSLTWTEGMVLAQPPNQGATIPLALENALSGRHIRVIWQSVADALFGTETVGSCDADGCVRVIGLHPALADFTHRTSLLGILAEVLRQAPNPEVALRQSVRYLLHGSAAHYDSFDTLLVGGGQADDVWARLAAQALRARGWRVIPNALAGELPQTLWDRLGIHQIDVHSVTTLLREAGPENIDTSQFSDQDLDVILRDIDQDGFDVLRSLRIHKEIHGQRRAIDGTTYLESRYPLAAELVSIVHLIAQHPTLSYKQMLLLPGRWWGPQFAIQVALAQSQPGMFWRPIMAGLAELGDSWRSQRVTTQLPTTAWLPRTDGAYAKPEDVVYLPGLDDHLARIAADTGGAFADVGMLLPAVREHSGFQALTSVFPSPEQALTMLGLAITEGTTLERLLIGGLSAEAFDLTQFLDAFTDPPDGVMDCAPFLQAVANAVSLEQCATILVVPHLLKPVCAGRTVKVLAFLADRHVGAPHRRPLLHDLHCRFLQTLATGNDGTEILPHIRLLNRAGTWCTAAELCTGNYNIAEAHVLDDGQARALRPILPSEQDATPELPAPGEEPGVPEASIITAERLDASVERLRQYFEPWAGACPDEVIGGFLAMLGDYPALKHLAQHYLGQRPVESIREQLVWTPLEAGVGAGEDVHQAMAQQRFLVEVQHGSEAVRVINLLGLPLDVPASQNFTNLLVGGNLRRSHVTGQGRMHRLTLRVVEPQAQEADSRLSEWLQNTAWEVLNYIYWQHPDGFDAFWEQLAESATIHLEVTQVRLLDHVLSSLKQYRLHTNPTLRALVDDWDDADRLEIEADHIPDPRRQRERKLEAEQRKRDVRTGLRMLFLEDPSIAAQFLDAVRERIHGHYQYQASSVPFELFQNADDAVVELLQDLGYVEDDQTNRCVVAWDGGSLSFAHWGRSINDARRLDQGTGGRPERGFHQDLEKMLMLGASDKGVEQDAPDVTGKLGMGFKSIFLLTDRPQVLSGSLCFEVIGAVFPQRLTGIAYEVLADGLRAYAPNRKGTGTLIRLPLQPGSRESLVENLARFHDLAPLLLVFSRKIKRIDMHLGGHQDRSLTWEETPVLGLPHVVTGRLPAGRNGIAGGRALVLRGRTGTDAVLLRLGARGAEPFPAEVPGIWVTAPTTEGTGFGFAMNGPFDLDVGRATLARTSQRNAELADRLGLETGEALLSLFQAAQQWEEFRQALDFASDVRAYDFWKTLLERLAAPFASDVEHGQERPDAALARRALWGSERHGAARLLAECAALPNGLWGGHEQLVRLDQVKHRVRGMLGQEAVFGACSGMDSFRARVTPGEIATDAVLVALPIPAPAGSRPLEIATVMRWELQPAYVVSPEHAARFGAVVAADAVQQLEHGGPVEQAEYQDLRRLLNDLRFRASDGSAQLARDLLLANSVDTDNPDEPRRASFAPASNLLTGDYAGDGLMFFKLCRGPQGFVAPAERLAEWGRAATDDRKRVAFLRYFLIGELGSSVGREASSIKAGSWLTVVEELDVLNEAAPTWGERSTILALLALLREAWYQPPSSTPLSPQPLQPKAALEKIFDWWQTNGPEQIAHFEETLYPGGQQLRLSADSPAPGDDLDGRKAWLELFILGATHTMGRTQDGQHRGFLQLCHDEGWMDVFATPRDQYRADAWMQAVREYLDPQVDLPRYYHWMRLFVPIFQLSWWLDDYVDLYLNADRLLRTMSFDQFLAPNTAVALQGGGITAPPLGRTLSTGAHFVLRELARGGLIENEGALRHCYVPSARVRALMQRLGCSGLTDDGDSRTRWSQEIYAFLKDHLGQERATFNNAFDIPLSIVARDASLQHNLFNSMVVDPAELFADEDEVRE